MVRQDHARIGVNRLANALHALRQEVKHRAVVVLAACVAPVKDVADRIDHDDVGGQAVEGGHHGRDDLRQPDVVQNQTQLRRGHEIGARQNQVFCGEPNAFYPLAQVVVLDLGLQVEHPQRPGRSHPQKRCTGGHVG